MILYIISCLCGISGQEMVSGLVTASLVFIVCFFLNQRGFIGGGDVKLLVPLLLFAENNAVSFLYGTSVGGLFLGIIYTFGFRKIFFLRRKMVLSLYLFKKNHRKSHLLSFVLLSLDRINRKAVAFSRYRGNALRQEIPYGVALACGGVSLLLDWCRW